MITRPPQLCQVLRVAPAAYYAWQRRQQQPTAETAWQLAVREAFAHHSQRYGTRRLRAEVRAQQPRSFVPRTTGSDPAVRAAPNLSAFHSARRLSTGLRRAARQACTLTVSQAMSRAPMPAAAKYHHCHATR